MLAVNEGHLSVDPKDACAAILDGYRESLVEGGRPFVLEEENAWLREIALNKLRDPVHFWRKMGTLPKFAGTLPVKVKKAFEQLMPQPDLSYKLCRRVAGLGSLGHIRVVALAAWHAGRIAREAKALAPSSICWVNEDKHSAKILYQQIIDQAVRCPDPFVRLRGIWVFRRLSPHCCRIELADLPRERDELRLLNAMGWETANIHLGSRKARKSVRRHLDRLRPDFLASAAKEMATQVSDDWKVWKRSGAG
jgi:hypothetical protein